MNRSDLERHQARLADLLLALDPAAALAAARFEPGFAAEFTAIDPDGLRIAALLVVKLRFQRLLNASREAAEWFERDGAGFTVAFRRYHHAVVPTAMDPWREAAAFAAWCAADRR
jgi:hypothetical protein